MDDPLDSLPAWITSAALILVTIIPLTAFWTLHLRNTPIDRPSQPVRSARVYLHLALPIWIMAVVSAAISPSITASLRHMGSMDQPYRSEIYPGALASMYTALISSFLTTTAAVFTTAAVCLAGMCTFYAVRSRQKWWKALQLNAICGSVLFVALAATWFGKTLANYMNENYRIDSLSSWYGFRFEWFRYIVDITLVLLAVGVVGVAIYVAVKFRSRSRYQVGNLPSLLLTASLLWLLRCVFVLAVDIKDIRLAWGVVELSAYKIVRPILDFWVSAAVLGLITEILRKPLWSDPTTIPDPGSWVQDGFVQDEMQYLQQPHHPQQPGAHGQQQPTTGRRNFVTNLPDSG
ncbi:uncharacterized protein C8A04DRAFT_31587 [Dichotomopilus funicola]|uniref:Uncharacterized protein n=1 Tax=Dichotomopilus funicola TaxID=1934379 RepID=A0AAN6UXU6_9PEZI|nr:hypothetical protein C8A04DRAFT_31587 [Dichotomopilus funicola]